MADNQNHLSPRWTPEQHAKALALWVRGVKVGTIAAEVKRSRNAVISRAARKGWGPHCGRSWQ